MLQRVVTFHKQIKLSLTTMRFSYQLYLKRATWHLKTFKRSLTLTFPKIKLYVERLEFQKASDRIEKFPWAYLCKSSKILTCYIQHSIRVFIIRRWIWRMVSSANQLPSMRRSSGFMFKYWSGCPNSRAFHFRSVGLTPSGKAFFFWKISFFFTK